MKLKSVTSQIRQSSLKGVDAVIIARTEVGVTRKYDNGIGCGYSEDVYFIDKRKINGQDTFFIGPQKGEVHFKSIHVQFENLIENLMKGESLIVSKINISPYFGQTLSDLVKEINYAIKEGKRVKFAYNVNDIFDLTNNPVFNRTAEIKAVIDYYKQREQKEASKLRGYNMHPAKKHSSKKCMSKSVNKMVGNISDFSSNLRNLLR